jgi:hypothetical protein
MSSVKEMSFDDSTLASAQVDRFKGTKDVTDRIAFVHLNPQKKPVIKSANVVYIEGAGYCIANEATEKLGYTSASQRFVAIIAHYTTDRLGKLKTPFTENSVNLKYYIFSKAKAERLSAINSEFPLSEHDLLAKCTEATYQKIDFTPCKEAAWKLKPEIKKLVEEQVAVLAKNMDRELGRTYTVEELKAKLGQATEADESSESANTGSQGSAADDILASL